CPRRTPPSRPSPPRPPRLRGRSWWRSPSSKRSPSTACAACT
ncbi:MAG: Mycofactocin precursor, partial [uncultured Blastococcus sp.]